MELNKIHYGDAYELIKFLPDKSVDLIVTDPPYLFKGLKKSGNTEMDRKVALRNAELTDAGIVNGIRLEILDEFVRVLKRINCYIWCNKAQIMEYLHFFIHRHNCSFEILLLNVGDKKLFTHPTIKPLKFIQAFIRNSSKANDLIFDPFMGSGTTAVAAAELGRRFVGFENNETWYKIACDRLNGIDASGQMGFLLR